MIVRVEAVHVLGSERMSDSRAIGIFDSGLGGLSVTREIIKALPGENLVYFGDTGRVPYGNKSVDVIRKYALEDEGFLLSRDVKMIVAACGTVSSVAADTAANLPVPFFEMITHAALAAVKATQNGKIGVLGTSATVSSGSHKKAIQALDPGISVLAQSCPLFVPLVEEGWSSPDDLIVLETVKRYLEPVLRFGADTLILGCTHYPILEDAIRAIAGDITLINPGVSVAAAIKEHLLQSGLENPASTGEHLFYVTDKPHSFQKIASILLGKEIDETKVKKVELNGL